jgi:N-acetyltransferase 10
MFNLYAPLILSAATNQPIHRYEIDGDAPAWQEAEKQVKKATRDGKTNTVVSVKTGKQKRKEGPTASDVYEEVLGDKSSRKKMKKSKK